MSEEITPIEALSSLYFEMAYADGNFDRDEMQMVIDKLTAWQVELDKELLDKAFDRWTSFSSAGERIDFVIDMVLKVSDLLNDNQKNEVLKDLEQVAKSDYEISHKEAKLYKGIYEAFFPEGQ